jgi:hypothetical protein
MRPTAFLARLAASMEHPVPDFHPEKRSGAKKPGLLAETGLSTSTSV